MPAGVAQVTSTTVTVPRTAAVSVNGDTPEQIFKERTDIPAWVAQVPRNAKIMALPRLGVFLVGTVGKWHIPGWGDVDDLKNAGFPAIESNDDYWITFPEVASYADVSGPYYQNADVPLGYDVTRSTSEMAPLDTRNIAPFAPGNIASPSQPAFDTIPPAAPAWTATPFDVTKAPTSQAMQLMPVSGQGNPVISNDGQTAVIPRTSAVADQPGAEADAKPAAPARDVALYAGLGGVIGFFVGGPVGAGVGGFVGGWFGGHK